MSQIATLTIPPLEAQAVTQGEVLEISLCGEITMEDPCAILDPFFQEVHQEASARGLSVAVNIQDLRFVNSSGLKVFIRWVTMAQQGEKDYKIRFLCNENHTWQRSSLAVIQLIAPTIVRLETPPMP